MMRLFFAALLLAGLGWISWQGYSAKVSFIVREEGPQPPAEIRDTAPMPAVLAASSSTSATKPVSLKDATTTRQIELTEEEVLSLADDKYAKGNIPLGDYQYATSTAKKGYVYLCNVRKDNPGAMVNGPWIHGTQWNYLEKISVDGSVSWPNATFSNKVSGSSRTISGNGLPVGHTTGVFPVSPDDDAAKYDSNPNTIKMQNLRKQLPANPTYSATPYCMGGESGIMLTGVPLFNAFDAGLRDAPAHELQDSCDGHPQATGAYHYHNLSSCFKDTSVTTVLGYALDGFPITGPKVADKKYLTTEDLDECHGITSSVIVDGKKKMTYHYVMTRDFPYSVSCFRGKPVSLMVIQGAQPQAMPPGPAGTTAQQPPPMNGAPPQNGGTAPTPPKEALTACEGHKQGDSCSVPTPDGTSISGRCDIPPGQSVLACIPH